MTVSRIMGPSDCSFKKYIEIYLIYCVVLASGVQQNDYCVYVYVFYSTVHCRFLQELKLKLQYIGHLMRRADSFEKTLMLRKIEDEIVGWHHRLNGHGFGWITGVDDG